LSAAGLATIQTTTNHGLTLTPGLAVNVASASYPVFNSSNYTKPFAVVSIPTLNTISFYITSSTSSQTPSSFSSKARSIKQLSRSPRIYKFQLDLHKRRYNDFSSGLLRRHQHS
jgi:hypothetical protein